MYAKDVQQLLRGPGCSTGPEDLQTLAQTPVRSDLKSKGLPAFLRSMVESAGTFRGVSFLKVGLPDTRLAFVTRVLVVIKDR